MKLYREKRNEGTHHHVFPQIPRPSRPSSYSCQGTMGHRLKHVVFRIRTQLAIIHQVLPKT